MVRATMAFEHPASNILYGASGGVSTSAAVRLFHPRRPEPASDAGARGLRRMCGRTVAHTARQKDSEQRPVEEAPRECVPIGKESHTAGSAMRIAIEARNMPAPAHGQRSVDVYPNRARRHCRRSAAMLLDWALQVRRIAALRWLPHAEQRRRVGERGRNHPQPRRSRRFRHDAQACSSAVGGTVSTSTILMDGILNCPRLGIDDAARQRPRRPKASQRNSNSSAWMRRAGTPRSANPADMAAANGLGPHR